MAKSPETEPPLSLSHVDQAGHARMVDVGDKPTTARSAVAVGRVRVGPDVAAAIRDNSLKKGDLLAVARIAGIQAAKRAADTIVMCHPLALTHVEVEATLAGEHVELRATTRAIAPTGVEMEALAAVSAAALNVVDMGKSLNLAIVIESIQVIEKHGGKTGPRPTTSIGFRPRVAILTVSDSRSAGTAEDRATAPLSEAAREWLHAEVIDTRLVPDERQAIIDQLTAWTGADRPPHLVLTTGGTGVGPRDVTPEATSEVIERPHPALLELARSRCLPGKPHAFLSRAVAGVAVRTLIVNVPGSPRGAVDTVRLMADVLPHALETLRDPAVEHPPS